MKLYIVIQIEERFGYSIDSRQSHSHSQMKRQYTVVYMHGKLKFAISPATFWDDSMGHITDYDLIEGFF